jgi:ArsR family transcriptional regulator
MQRTAASGRIRKDCIMDIDTACPPKAKTRRDPLRADTFRGDALEPFAFEASSLLKALGHEGRLMILSHLRDGAMTVAELKERIPASQSVISSHLARLRHEGLVRFRKDGKNHYYDLADGKARDVIDLISGVFCAGLSGPRA